MSEIPHFDSEHLQTLAKAFRGRRRSLSESACRVDLAKTLENGAGRERLEIEIGGVVGKGPVLRLHAWPDRSIWVDAKRAAKEGSAWGWSTDGHLNSECGSRQFIETLEATYELIGEISAGRTATLDDLWKPLLARKPKSAK